jgi:VIT1/CCC1 family predicted Fe2+/Mn2+ transporter
MDNSKYLSLVSDLDASPGVIVGFAFLLTAILIFSPYARAKLNFRLSQLLWTLTVSGGLLCTLGYLTGYLS